MKTNSLRLVCFFIPLAGNFLDTICFNKSDIDLVVSCANNPPPPLIEPDPQSGLFDIRNKEGLTVVSGKYEKRIVIMDANNNPHASIFYAFSEFRDDFEFPPNCTLEKF